MKGLMKYVLMSCMIIVSFFIGGCSSKPAAIVATKLSEDGYISKDNFYEKTVYYGTTRADLCNVKTECDTNLSNLNKESKLTSNKIKYGKAIVKIPFVKKVGGTSGMSLVSFKHNIGWNNFISQLSDNDILIFIHGYSTSFKDAAIRCAQLAHDTNFKGEAVFFSWPSSGKLKNYAKDKERAEENFTLLAQFLEKIRNQTKKDIHIVAHSMGTYILVNSLTKLNNKFNNLKPFNQIILAAPDINQSEYDIKFHEYNLKNKVERITLYSSVNDHVLDFSQIVNYFIEGTGEARLGDSQKEFFVIDGMDTIDTRQEISPQFFGHSFYANYRSLVSDIYLLLNYGTDPDSRMLQKVKDKNGNILWFIRD